MQGKSQGAKVEFLPLTTPLINQLPYYPETTSPGAQDQALMVRMENKASSQLSSQAVATATLLAKKAAI